MKSIFLLFPALLFAITVEGQEKSCKVNNLIFSDKSTAEYRGVSGTGGFRMMPQTTVTISGGYMWVSDFLMENGSSFVDGCTTGNGHFLTVAGSSTVKCMIPGNEWHLISSPVSDAVSGMFKGKFLMEHRENDNTYYDIISTSVPLTPVKGYALWGDDEGFTAEYTGSLNAGAIEANWLTRNTAITDRGWNLAGNPYPSSIDWSAATGWTKTNMDDAIYLHVNASTWATYVGGVGNNGGTQYIAPCQGFFVRVSEGQTAGALAMTNAVRVHHATSFFKSSAEEIPGLIRLEVTGNGYNDETVVRILDASTAGFDGDWDAYKLFGSVEQAPQLYSAGSFPLSINSIPEPVPVSLGIRAGISGTYTIRALEINDLVNVKLEDKQTGIITALADKSYTFNWSAGENEDRFILRFDAIGMEEPVEAGCIIYSCDNVAVIDLPVSVQADIFIYNLKAQLIVDRISATGQVRFSPGITGIYVVKVITNTETITRKVFIR